MSVCDLIMQIFSEYNLLLFLFSFFHTSLFFSCSWCCPLPASPDVDSHTSAPIWCKLFIIDFHLCGGTFMIKQPHFSHFQNHRQLMLPKYCQQKRRDQKLTAKVKRERVFPDSNTKNLFAQLGLQSRGHVWFLHLLRRKLALLCRQSVWTQTGSAPMILGVRSAEAQKSFWVQTWSEEKGRWSCSSQAGSADFRMERCGSASRLGSNTFNWILDQLEPTEPLGRHYNSPVYRWWKHKGSAPTLERKIHALLNNSIGFV